MRSCSFRRAIKLSAWKVLWARAGSSTCSCEFCQQFNSFLADPELAPITIEKTLKRNLLHVQEMIDNKQFDIVGNIVSEKNKFSGHFSKNEASYLKALKLFQKILSSSVMEDMQL